MKKVKKTLEEEINEFLEHWDCKQMHNFFRDIVPLIDLYNLEEGSDWVAEAVGEEDARNVRMIRTIYLVSRIAEFHAAKLVSVKASFKDIYLRMEKEGAVEVVH